MSKVRKRVENGYLGCFSELTEGKGTGKNLLQMLIEEYFPFGGSDSKEFACSAAAPGSVPGSRRSPGEGNGNSLQYSWLENPVDRGTWWAIIHGVTRVRHDCFLLLKIFPFHSPKMRVVKVGVSWWQQQQLSQRRTAVAKKLWVRSEDGA